MLIELKGVNKTYDNGQPLHVLKGIDLSIDKGEFVSIMGASGSGKSTLLNILGILDNYDTGEYWLDGKLIRDLTETQAADYRNRMIGFIFQSYNLIGFKTAVENVELPLFYQGVSRRKRHQMALEYLDRLGLKDWASHYPNEMSGGQKQRVAIARALITRPRIVLADEPTGALDSKTSVEIMELLQQLNREEGMTIIVVTHESGVHPYQRRNHRRHRREPATRRFSLRDDHHYEINDARPLPRNLQFPAAEQTPHGLDRFCGGMGHLHADCLAGCGKRGAECADEQFRDDGPFDGRVFPIYQQSLGRV